MVGMILMQWKRRGLIWPAMIGPFAMQLVSLWSIRTRHCGGIGRCGENDVIASIQATLALARVGGAELQEVLERLDRLPLEQLPEEQLLEALRAYGVALLRMGGTRGVRGRVIQRLEHLFPSSSKELNQELCRLLVYLQDPGVIDKSLKLLRASQVQGQMFYFATLSQLRNGWTLQQRRVFFRFSEPGSRRIFACRGSTREERAEQPLYQLD